MMEGRIRDSAQELLDSLVGELAQEEFRAAVEKGRSLELDQIFAEFAA
jgi:hypothetical protein